jgi:hypothetical protein
MCSLADQVADQRFLTEMRAVDQERLLLQEQLIAQQQQLIAQLQQTVTMQQADIAGLEWQLRARQQLCCTVMHGSELNVRC